MNVKFFFAIGMGGSAFCVNYNDSIYSYQQMLVSPVLAGLAVAIGVPILLFYVYGVVPGKANS